MSFKFKTEIDPITNVHYRVLGSRRVKVWTEQEIQLLRKLYPTSVTEDLCDVFYTNARYIARKASKLGIHKDKEWLKKQQLERIAYCRYKTGKKYLLGSHFKTPEWRERMRKQCKERVWTDEQKQKLSLSLKRYFQNPQNRKKHSEAMKIAMAKRFDKTADNANIDIENNN